MSNFPQDYFGLALNNPDKYVKLKNANVNIRLVDVKKNDNGEVVELIAEHCEGKMANSKVHPIHWVPIVVCFFFFFAGPWRKTFFFLRLGLNWYRRARNPSRLR